MTPPTSTRAPSPSTEPTTIDGLFRDEYEPMLRLAFVLTGDQHAAEEVVQDGFVAVQARWASLHNPGGYLRTTIVNGARQRPRRSDRRRRIERERLAGDSETAATTEPDYLLDVLARLPERQRAAVVLAYYGRLGSNEIADLLGCRPGTAKSLVHRGLARLRKDLADAV